MSTNFREEVLRLAKLRQQETDIKRLYATQLQEVKSATSNANAVEKALREAAQAEYNARVELGTVAEDEKVELTPELRIQWRDVTEYSLEENIIAIIQNAPQLVSIDLTELRKMVKRGEAAWAIPAVRHEPYVVLSDKLGDLLIKEELDNALIVEPEAF